MNAAPNEAPETQLQEVFIRSLEDLVGALNGGDANVRLAVLQALAQQAHPLPAYPPYLGLTLTPLLISTLEQTRSTLERFLLLLALEKLDDPRTLETFARMMAQEEDPDLLALARDVLLRHTTRGVPQAVRTRLIPLLGSEPLERARLVAQVLAGDPHLKPRSLLWLELLLEEEVSVCLDKHTLLHWLEALNGPLGPSAKAALERQGESAWSLLVAARRSLSLRDHRWLLGWGARHSYPHLLPLLHALLHSAALRLSALETYATLKTRPALEPELWRTLLSPDEPALMAAAVRAGAPIELWWTRLDELDTLEWTQLEAMLPRALERGKTQALERWRACLGHADWRVRALAAQLLADAGSAGLEGLKAALESPQEEVRVAAAGALWRSGALASA